MERFKIGDKVRVREDLKNDDMFEENAAAIKFTKSDLEDGMVVEQRDGCRAVVLNGCFMEYDSFTEFNEYNDDLTVDDSRFALITDVHECDIVKVYTSEGKTFKNLIKDCYLHLIWERKEEHYKEMTIKEIEKELGYKIKVIE